MGGVSAGQARFLSEGDLDFARLTGTVRTENNGGFIQVRRKLTNRPSADTSGVRLVVRGNGEQYFIHLRTRGTVLPWQYYQADFTTSEQWTEIRLPLSARPISLRCRHGGKLLVLLRRKRRLPDAAFLRPTLTDLRIRKASSSDWRRRFRRKHGPTVCNCCWTQNLRAPIPAQAGPSPGTEQNTRPNGCGSSGQNNRPQTFLQQKQRKLV